MTRKRTLVILALGFLVRTGWAGVGDARLEEDPSGWNADAALKSYWESESFKKRFLGSYGINSDIEPKFANPEEQAFYAELRSLVFDRPTQAIEKLRKALKPDSSALLNFTLGALYFQEGSVTNAVSQYEQAIEKFPDFRRAHRNLGVLLVREGSYAKAIPHLTETIELGGGDGATFGLLGIAYLNRERYISAEIALKNAILFTPESAEWKLGLAQSYMRQEKFWEALALFDELLAANPESESLWNLQATVYLQLEKTEAAAVNYEILRKLGEAKPRTLMLLGDIYMLQGADELAEPVYLEAIHSPNELDAGRAIRAAEVLANQGAYEAAQRVLADIRKHYAGKLDQDKQTRLLKAESRVALATEDSERALQVLEQVLERDPLDGEALLMVGDYYARTQETEKAMHRYETAAKIEGFEAKAYVKQAQLLVQAAKYAEAISLLIKAQKIRPREHIQRYLEAVERVARAAGS